MEFTQFASKYESIITDMGQWMVDDTGVYRIATKGKGADAIEYPVYACRVPLFPVKVFNNIDSGIEKVQLAFLKHGRKKNLTVNKGVIANKSNILKLADDGVEVNSDSAGELMKYLSDMLCMNPIPFSDSKSTLGWVQGGFVPYSSNIAYDADDAFKHLYKAVRSSGDREKYIEYVKGLRRYSLPLRLAMAASFASPIIEKIGENPFVLMIYGGTGIAKSVALMVAMSVWGNPAFGAMTRTMDMTANSMMATAAFLRNLPFAGDELQTIKNRWGNYDNLVMKVTEGVDRGRMTFSTVNETKTWKCSFLFTGEEPITKAQSGGGVKNRVIELECQKKLVENGNETANFVKENYGLVGEEYIKALSHYDLNAMYREYFTELMKAVETTDKQAGAMAIMMVADKIARDEIFHDSDPLLVCVTKDFLCNANDVDIAERAYDFIVGTIGENAQGFIGGGYGKRWGVFDLDDNSIVYINAKTLNEVLTNAGFDFVACRKRWQDKGYLLRDSASKQYRFTRRIAGVAVWSYKLQLPFGGRTRE